jgi:hypothetical protein
MNLTKTAITVILNLLLVPHLALAVAGDACLKVANCTNTNLDLGFANENGFDFFGVPDETVTAFFDAVWQPGFPDTFFPCGYVWTAVYDDTVLAPESLVPRRSPVGGNGDYGCSEASISPTIEVPTANKQITCWLLDEDPASNPSGPDLDPNQGELLVTFSVPEGAPSFSGPVFAFKSVSVVEWDGSSCVTDNSFFGPPTMNSLTVIGSDLDMDLDGVVDTEDNCTEVPNGFLGAGGNATPVPLCNSQEDGDLDGYGNPCDFDVNGDGATSITDALEIFAQALNTDSKWDMNCNGAADINDALDAFEASNIVAPPGPSGLACASLCEPPDNNPPFTCTAVNAPCPPPVLFNKHGKPRGKP